MRAHEFVPEELQREIDNFEPFKKEFTFDGITYVVDFEVANLSRWLHINAYDESGVEVGWIDFEIVGDELVSLDTYVSPQFRRQGIATRMYRIVKDMGNDVIPSKYRTPLGKRLWKGMTAKGSLGEAQMVQNNI